MLGRSFKQRTDVASGSQIGMPPLGDFDQCACRFFWLGVCCQQDLHKVSEKPPQFDDDRRSRFDHH